MGRLVKIYVPGCSEPSTELEYFVSSPLSYVKSIQNETCQEESTDSITEPTADISHAGYIRYLYIDGLGRGRATINEGDELNPWIVTEHTIYDAKGASFGVYMPYSISSEWEFTPEVAPQPLLSRTIYDAFGRIVLPPVPLPGFFSVGKASRFSPPTDRADPHPDAPTGG